MTSLSWKIRRLRAMGPGELVFRVGRAVGARVERFRISRGWAPKPLETVGLGVSLFPLVDGWLEYWSKRYRLDDTQLAAFARGEISFFGYPPMAFGDPVSWHRDPETGIVAPLIYGKSLDYRNDALVGNVKVVWELGRHQHLVPLAVAYACGGERRYQQAIVAQIEGWINDNPFGLGIHWCSALEVALRLVSWALVHSLLMLRDPGRGLFDVCDDANKLGAAIYQQAWFVRHFLSRHSSANNHLIGELTGLFVACKVFDLGATGTRWAVFAKQELETEAARQVYADGVDREQAFYYHLWVLEYLLFTWIVGERTGVHFGPAFRQRLAAMGDFIHAITPAGGQPPQVGDADDGFVSRFEAGWPEYPYESVLAALDHVQGLRRRPSTEHGFDQKAFWYGLIAGRLPSEEEPEVTRKVDNRDYPIVFSEAGYAVLGGNGLHLLFDAGSLGYLSTAAHGHADALSICLAVEGEWWLVDPGTYVYHSDVGWRNYFRGTSAHNTLVVDNLDQSEIGGPFLWSRHARAVLTAPVCEDADVQCASGWHDGFERLGVVHRRVVRLSRARRWVEIHDSIEGRGRHRLALYFHFDTEVNLVAGRGAGEWIACRPDATRYLDIKVDPLWEWNVYRGSEFPRLGWYSPALGRKEPAYTLVGNLHGDIPREHCCRITVKG